MAKINITIDELEKQEKFLRENTRILEDTIRNIKMASCELNRNWSEDKLVSEIADNCEKMSVSELARACDELTEHMRNVIRLYQYAEAELCASLMENIES